MIVKSKELLSIKLPRWADFPPFELYVDQVIAFVTERLMPFSAVGEPIITQAMINNYVKNGVLHAPIKKKYDRTHLAKLFVICISKRMLPLSYISESIALMSRVFDIAEGYDDFCDEVEYEIRSAVDPSAFPPRAIDSAPSARERTMRALASAVARVLVFDKLVEQRRRLSAAAGKMASYS